MSSKDCIKQALLGLQNFSKEDLEDYVRDVFNRAREYGDVKNMKAFDRAMNEINQDHLRNLFEDASIKANNTLKYEANSEAIKSGKANLRKMLAKRNDYLGDNVPAAKRAAETRLMQVIFRELNFEEMEYLTSGKNDEMIADAFDGRKVDDAIPKKIADKLLKYFDYRNGELILSNAMRFNQINDDRMFRQIHDASKMMNGQKSLINAAKDFLMRKYDMKNSKLLWREFIKQHLELEETFKHTKAMNEKGELNMATIDEMLDSIYDNITTYKSEIFTQSSVRNDREAVQRKSRMFFKFKDMRSFLQYNKVYGKNNLFGALRSDMRSSAGKIGMAEKWGDSPYNMYLDLEVAQKERGDKNHTPFWYRNTDNYFKTSMGLDQSVSAPRVATFFANSRSITAMARLPLVMIQSISDIAYSASFAQRMGINYWKAWGNNLKHIFNLYTNDERQYLASLFKLQVDSHLGFMGRWSDANNTNELMSKISSGYFKGIGLEAFDQGNKISIMHLMSKHLYNNSSKKFGELNSSLQKWVSKFMNEKEWDLLRKNNKGALFTTDNVEALSESEIKSFYESGEKKLPLYEVRNDLYRRVHAMFDVASENAVLSPGEFERAWCFQGQPAGTLTGEFLRTISQFKMYTMSYIDRVIMNGLQDADTAQQKIAWATSMFLGTLPLSFLSMYLGNAAKNLTMPDWDMMNTVQREKFMIELLAPSLAMFSGLLDPYKRNSDMVLSLLASPTTRLISNALGSASALAGGDPEGAKKQLGRAANYVLPIQNTPILSPILDDILGREPHLEPGQTKLFGH